MLLGVTDSFPRHSARTQRFTLGEPRNVSVSPDGERVVFLRSAAGDDPVNALWVLDVETGEERLVADPRAGHSSPGELTSAERARRERTRESASGITGYATDASVRVAAFVLGGQLHVAGLVSGRARVLDVDGPAFDPRPDPLARRLAYVSDRALCVAELNGHRRVLAGGDDDPETVSWGVADFVAAEEMHRVRGFWWSPDGAIVAACRVDTGPVSTWSISDPSRPEQPPQVVRYPAAGTANADVTLHLLGLDGSHARVEWDADRYPYLAAVDWSEGGLVIQVQSRDQQATAFFGIDPVTGETDLLAFDQDDRWVELVPGTPRVLADGTLVRTIERHGARRLVVGDDIVTPRELQVRAVVGAGTEGITFLANDIDDATCQHVWRREPNGRVSAMTDSPGVHTAAVGGPTTVVRSTSLEEGGARMRVLRSAAPDDAGTTRSVLAGPCITSMVDTPELTPNVTLLRAGADRLATAVLLPTHHDGSPLPVLLDPYGGPHALRVTRTRHAYLGSQWFADQGFAVVITDGRGTPGRGTKWERRVFRDLAGTLDDQVAALEAAAAEYDVLDLSRVGIRGWSFGGYLAALAVLKRPQVFHAAIAGAPVTEWRLYDTHYTERYLGDPNERPDVYDANSLLGLAANLRRPLLLIHGFADDNVVVAHTLRLSSALLAAGKPHEVLPLTGITHMASDEVVAENLLLHQLDFLERTLLDRTVLERTVLDRTVLDRTHGAREPS
jgi:dipeptidyl-peptidase 4